MLIKLDKDAIMPTKAYETDAGWDLYSTIDTIVSAKSSAIIDTGVHIQIPTGFTGFLKSKSGLNVKHNIISTGVIDSGYTGSIIVKLYNLGETDYSIKKGDKVTQLVILPCVHTAFQQVQEFEITNRGDNGFGSSGK